MKRDKEGRRIESPVELVEYSEKAQQVVSDAFINIQKDLSQKILTVMDVHAFPKDVLNEEDEKISLQEWIEREALPLKTPEDFEYFTKIVQLLKILAI